MKIPNPVKLFRERQKKKERSNEACEVLADRIKHISLPENHKERTLLTVKFKEKGVTALVLKNLSEAAARDVVFFKKCELRIMTLGGVTLLSELKDRSFFSKVAITLRDLYAEDVAHEISCEDTVKVIVGYLLFYP